MPSYQVTRAFGPHKPGDVLPQSALAGSHRAAQLIDQRYLTPLPDGLQPTAAALLSASVRRMDTLAALVQDGGVVRDAMAQETRDTALRLLERRLQELEPIHDET